MDEIALLTRELGMSLYRIEVEQETVKGKTDPVFEIVRIRGGAVGDEHEGTDFKGDPAINSKDIEFLKWVVQYGLEDQLREAVRKAYAVDVGEPVPEDSVAA